MMKQHCEQTHVAQLATSSLTLYEDLAVLGGDGCGPATLEVLDAASSVVEIGPIAPQDVLVMYGRTTVQDETMVEVAPGEPYGFYLHKPGDSVVQREYLGVHPLLRGGVELRKIVVAELFGA